MNKKRSERKHAKRRLAERYHLFLNDKILEDLLKKIRTSGSHKDVFKLGRQTNRTSKLIINYSNQMILAIYDKQRKEIITVLPQEDILYELKKYFIYKNNEFYIKNNHFLFPLLKNLEEVNFIKIENRNNSKNEFKCSLIPKNNLFDK